MVQLPGRLAPVLAMSDAPVEPLPMDGRHRLLRASRRARSADPEVGVLLTPAFSAALLLLLSGVGRRRGTDTDGRRWLLTDPVDREPLLRGHRVAEYLALVEGARPGAEGADGAGVGTGAGAEPPRPRLERRDGARDAWRALGAVPAGPDGGDRPLAGLVPGGRAPSRRWPRDRWRELARRLLERGFRVAVFGGPDEEELTAAVAAGRPGAHSLGGRTDLAALAGGLLACDVVAANDTGPMHLAAALDRPLVVAWGAGDPDQTRPLSPGVRLLGTPDLPCHPCLEETCPRTGSGYRSPSAERECLRLVGVDRMEEAVLAAADEGGSRAARRGRPTGTGPRTAGRGREEAEA